jgi:microcystin-dependent protein
MSDPFLGEIRLFGGNFAPRGWSFCDGSLLAISQNDALFALLGTTYGGDGQSTFGLPDLRGRLPIHMGTQPGGPTYTLGESAGSESVTLTQAQMPAHSHALLASQSPAEGADPRGNVLAGSDSSNFYGPANADKAAAMNPGFVGQTGGSQPHDNLQPFLCVSFIIALEGIFPQQS